MQNRLQGWSKEYELGIKEIDLQHQYFFRLITRLADELKNSSDFPYQKSLFVELGLYTHFHFVSEENLMQRSGYPGLHEHKKLHNKLIDGLNKNKLLFEEGHIEAIQVIDFLKMWFISHTVKEDRKFAEYIIG
ncbi:MAG: bacteriohemerythrin [Candidatus Thiodiazotropha sp. (ex Lucina aurantia)]|nr:bacteriohemerythrin [Candidatus Thiodiazotropha sp. (ex Lucina pensylvanica)]MBT3016975.1 bacteriohemerythrin [Candidatus Thiodiazotropha taylori]MBT3043873.1 bacteriohemerythrin [Candidatus Thiodiazotropha sp. (ex Codakia orbicularis)]MBV2105271.1 bacteriohemerythrin [Candidatus Thiodiazotropha sp. (ex Lucina aurantia)]MCG7862062.1 bacteriohemerythrin [Candidatus Thiodiazotropha endolucinida]